MKEVSEDIDIDIVRPSKECIICHYWYFLDRVSMFQRAVWNGCHGVLMMSISLNSIFILNIHRTDYHCIIAGITKFEAINLLKNADLSEKKCLIFMKNKKWIKQVYETEKRMFHYVKKSSFNRWCRYW